MAGALCGGVFLDENFINLIKSKLPQGAWDKVSKAEEKRFLNDGWEHGIKPQFANQHRTWLVDLPDAYKDNSPRKLKRRRALELSANEILSAFSPIVDKIVSLVRRQSDSIQEKYSQPPKHIILVGGFGRSRYLFDRLQAEFKSTVLQSQGSNREWTAICRGAVVHELSRENLCLHLGIKVESRIARMSYGITYWEPYNEHLHRRDDMVWSESNYKYMARNQMIWFLKEGHDITGKQPVRHSFRHTRSEAVGYAQVGIHCSSASPPPSRADNSVRRLCQITWNRYISLESLPTYTNPIGKVYRELNFEVEMTCEDGTVDFAAYHKGERVGARNVEVDFY
ncbi:hypothetical protein ACHAPT_010084 [Fusarium lateritium]